MAVFRIEKTKDFTVMSNHHLRNSELSLKAKGLLSQMLSLPENWDYTLAGLSNINRESKDAIRSAINELERAGYIVRRQTVDARGKFSSNEYIIREFPEPLLEKPSSENPTTENPTTENPITENPITGNPITGNPSTENPTQSNKDILNTNKSNTDEINYSSINHRAEDRTDEREALRDIIQENIDYEIISQTSDGERISEMVEIMLDAICSKKSTVRINGEDIPKEAVKSRFLKLDSEHIEYVLLAMQRSPSKIRNIKAYLLTALYNAPTTMDNYFAALVNHDLNMQE